MEQSVYSAHYNQAVETIGDIDPDDAPFVALTYALNLPLWTNDKDLITHEQVFTITTKELLSLSRK